MLQICFKYASRMLPWTMDLGVDPIIDLVLELQVDLVVDLMVDLMVGLIDGGIGVGRPNFVDPISSKTCLSKTDQFSSI